MGNGDWCTFFAGTRSAELLQIKHRRFKPFSRVRDDREMFARATVHVATAVLDQLASIVTLGQFFGLEVVDGIVGIRVVRKNVNSGNLRTITISNVVSFNEGKGRTSIEACVTTYITSRINLLFDTCNISSETL